MPSRPVRPASSDPAGSPRRLRSLRTELLFSLAFLTSSAVIIVGLTTLLLSGADPRDALPALVALWVGSTLTFLLFGHYLLRRMVLRPLELLAHEADRLAEGVRDDVAVPLDSAEFARLAERFRAMADQLLDVQSQVVRAEKLAGIGRLAAGVAHEIRNPLGAVANYAEVLRRRGVDPTVVDAMRREVDRIDRIVESLLDYARPAAPSGHTDLNDAARETVAFLQAQGALRDVEVVLALAESLPPVRGDRQAIDQVLVNLILNARDAAPGGRMEIGTVRKVLDRHSLERRWDDLPAAGPEPRGRRTRPWRPDLGNRTAGALLYVADTGSGVAEADRERIFDPFFTTKDPGQGTGLGLAIVARTVHESGGVVWVDPAREGGAVFKVFLPAREVRDARPDR